VELITDGEVTTLSESVVVVVVSSIFFVFSFDFFGFFVSLPGRIYYLNISND
jgi:hypothetical protein